MHGLLPKRLPGVAWTLQPRTCEITNAWLDASRSASFMCEPMSFRRMGRQAHCMPCDGRSVRLITPALWSGLGGRLARQPKTPELVEPDTGSELLPELFYRGARTTLRGIKVGLSVSHWNCLLLGPRRGPRPSRKADLRRRSGLAGAYRAPIGARQSLSETSRQPDSQGASSARHTGNLLACCPHGTRRPPGRRSLGGLA